VSAQSHFINRAASRLNQFVAIVIETAPLCRQLVAAVMSSQRNGFD